MADLLKYREYEEEVFHWLMAKHETNPDFTFSLRQNGSKGAELDYFIGTSKSNYFGTTFWTLPVSFPGSSGDCIDLIIKVLNSGFSYYFEFTQTKNPLDEQNKLALQFIQSLAKDLEIQIGVDFISADEHKMYTIKTKPVQNKYTNLKAMLTDVEKQLDSILDLVDRKLVDFKKIHSSFIMHRITLDEFNSMLKRKDKRFLKYEDVNSDMNFEESDSNLDFNDIVEKFSKEDIDNYFSFLNRILTTLNISYNDKRVVYSVRENSLNFIIGQRYCWNLFELIKGKFGVISKDKINESSTNFKGKAPQPFYTQFDEFNLTEINFDSIIDQLLIELNRTNKSSFRKWSNNDFENRLFKINSGSSKKSEFKAPLNQILYGPPGTGKTYNSINKAIEIINPNFDLTQERETVKNEFDRLVAEGQIVFTTFHQSMAYEDFIEGIKPKIDEDANENRQVVYEIEDGIFKRLVDNAKKVKTASMEIIDNYSFDDAWDDLVKEAERNLESKNPLVLSIQTPNLGLKIIDISERGNLKLKPIYSEDAKEYTVSYSRAKKLQEAFPVLSVVKNIDKEFRAVIGGSNSTAYWSILNNINQKINQNSKIIKQENMLPALPHVLIIDEINRGNVSQIFGELITLIEESKRLGEIEALEVTLSYSKKKFGVPPNLYIIGTMNTADRSVEALDTALRRRFSFVEMMPDEKVIEEKNFNDFDRVTIMRKINQRIEVLLDRNYTLGHSYFIKEDFKNSFENEIIPLLQEYFYNDYGKIGLVLGKGFVRVKAITAKNDKSIFADFDSKNEVDINKSYELIPFTEINFEEAIQFLLA